MFENQDTSFVRHRGPVTCAAGIPGTRKAVTSGYDGAVALFDLDSGEVELLGYHKHLVNRVTINAAGTLVASSSSDYTVIIWDLATHKVQRVLRGHADDVEDFAFLDDGMGASVSRDWRVIFWNLENGSIVQIPEGHEKDALSVSYADGKVYTSGDDMTMRMWDAKTGKMLKLWGPFASETDTSAIDPIHGRAVLGCDDGVIRIFDINTGEMYGEMKAHSSGIKKVAVSPKTGDILSAAYDQKVHIWDANTLERKITLEGKPTLWERSFNWSPDGQTILAGTFDGTVLVWDTATGKCLAELGDQKQIKGNACFNEVSANARGDIALVSDDGYVRLAQLNRAKKDWVKEVEPATGRMLMNAVTLDDASELVVTGAHNHRIHIFQRVNGSLNNEIELALGEGPINSIRVCHYPGYEDISYVACYSGAIVKVSKDGQILGKFRVHENAVKALRLHPTKPIGVSCSADGILVSWDLDGNLLHHFLGHMAIIDDVDIDPTGQYIASTGRDFTVKVYRLDDAQLLHTVNLGHRSPKGILFYGEHTVIIANYWGELLKLDLPGEHVTRRQIAENGISSVVRSGDNVVATSYDGTVYLVNPDDLHVVSTLKAMQQRVGESAYA
jgi:toxoflavin biosynthesis protein ToxC